MKSIYDVIIKPIITEKTSLLSSDPTKLGSASLQYTFQVAKDANKVEIKEAVEKIFNVKVVDVRTINVHRKAKRLQRYEGFKPAYKKAIVKLAPGQTLSVFEV